MKSIEIKRNIIWIFCFQIEFFESEKGKDAGSWMLKMWTEQEKEDATAADLLYQLEGLKLRELVREVFPWVELVYLTLT